MTLSEFGHRRLRASQGGLWFVGLTVLVGLVAMASGNNVLYVIECFLLGLFVVSGLVSEAVIRRVTVTWHPKGSFAARTAHDRWVIRNNSWLPVFALSVGFKVQKSFITHARIFYLGPRQTAVLESILFIQHEGCTRLMDSLCSQTPHLDLQPKLVSSTKV
jgi:hypothetical protein